jgi:hypothetical protein
MMEKFRMEVPTGTGIVPCRTGEKRTYLTPQTLDFLVVEVGHQSSVEGDLNDSDGCGTTEYCASETCANGLLQGHSRPERRFDIPKGLLPLRNFSIAPSDVTDWSVQANMPSQPYGFLVRVPESSSKVS